MHRPNARPDVAYIFILATLTVVGVVFLASASSVVAFERFGSSYHFVVRQLLYGIVPGVILAFAAAQVPHQWYRTLAPLAFFGGLVLLALPLIPGVGVTAGGCACWVRIGQFAFQPSEVAKIAFIFAFAGLLTREEPARLKGTLLPAVAFFGLIATLLMREPDVGTLVVYLIIGAAMVLVSGLPLRYLAILIIIGGALLGILIFQEPYRVARLTTFIHPELDPQGVGYQINQALLAVGSGGPFGLGLGHSRQKFQYLPEVTSDSIFAIVGEEGGFLLATGIFALIVALYMRGLKIAARAKSQFERLLVIGIAHWFFGQSILNIGAITGLLPLTGVPLPFISHGGTAMVAAMTAVGVVIAVSKRRL